MFNKTLLVQTKTEHVPYVKTVIEKRAPTDDSIRIYEEVKEKAYASIVDTIEIRDNAVNIKAILYRDLFTFAHICKYVVRINGHKLKGEIDISEFDFKDKFEFVNLIFKRVSEHLAGEMIKTFSKELRMMK